MFASHLSVTPALSVTSASGPLPLDFCISSLFITSERNGSPALLSPVHRHVLGGGQEVEDEEHGGEGHHVGDDDVLLREEINYFSLLVSEVLH